MDDAELSRRVGGPPLVQRVFDQLPLPVLAMEGVEHRVVATTDAYRVYADRQYMIGMPVREVFPEALGQQIWPIFDRVYASGESLDLPEFRAQFDRPEVGQTVEVFIDLNAYPRRGPGGDIVGVTAYFTDVTGRVRERRASQRRTSEAERRYAAARDVVVALQRELLPSGVPLLPRVQIAASYLLADSDTAAGGDWFDALVLPDRRVALVVGDVVGHGVAASATMSQLRVLLHEQLATEADILAALTAVDAAAGRIPGARAAAVCVVAFDPVTGELEYCTAGHPPPLVLSTAGGARYLPGTGAGPVGVGVGFTAATIGTDRLADDELVLLLYTDGILERPGRQPAQGRVELAQAADDIAADRALSGDADLPAERVCTQTLELLTWVTGHSDDITLLAGQRTAPLPDFVLHPAAEPKSLVKTRRALDTWLTDDRWGYA